MYDLLTNVNGLLNTSKKGYPLNVSVVAQLGVSATEDKVIQGAALTGLSYSSENTYGQEQEIKAESTSTVTAVISVPTTIAAFDKKVGDEVEFAVKYVSNDYSNGMPAGSIFGSFPFKGTVKYAPAANSYNRELHVNIPNFSTSTEKLKEAISTTAAYDAASDAVEKTAA